MKTSKAYFNRFVKEFIRRQELLGLTQYRTLFSYENIGKKNAAQIRTNFMAKTADVYLNTEKRSSEGPEADAKHEALHLLLSRLCILAEERHIMDTDIPEEEEAIVQRLEKVWK